MKRLFVLSLAVTMLFCLAACNENNIPNTEVTNNSAETTSNTQHTNPVFKTKNITRITFYGYYGNGEGSDVPSKHMTEITNWLGTFTIDKKAPDVPVPGTNTVYVEIEYSDGAVIKNGLDTVTIDGITYKIKHGKEPECYREILSHTSLSEPTGG